MPGLLGWNNQAVKGLLNDFTTGVSRLPYRSLGAPVDLATGLLRPFGYDVEKPIGGSDWMIEKAAQAGIARKPTGTGAELAGDVVGGLLDPNPGPEAALAMKAAGLLGDPSTGGLLQALTVFHGSPHRINNVDDAHPLGRFDLSKVGTGEGAQAYGHGIYLAENPKVAGEYRNKVQGILPDGTVFAPGWDDPRFMGLNELRKNGGDIAKARAEVEKWVQQSGRWPDQLSAFDEMVKAGVKVDPGHFYTVDLPDEHIANMLDWDAPLSQQPEAVRKALKEYAAADDATITGGEFYRRLTQESGASPEEVSSALRAAGVPGIRYLDGGSRTTSFSPQSKGTRNFVIFDGDTAKILKRE